MIETQGQSKLPDAKFESISSKHIEQPVFRWITQDYAGIITRHTQEPYKRQLYWDSDGIKLNYDGETAFFNLNWGSAKIDLEAVSRREYDYELTNGLLRKIKKLTNGSTKMIETPTATPAPQDIATPDFYKQRLRDFAAKTIGVFVIEDVLEHLEIDPDCDGARYAIPSITHALRELGCKPERLLCFIPPSSDGRKLSKDIEHQMVQHIINVIRDTVLSKRTMFKISDLYANPDISTALPCDCTTITLIKTALHEMGCTLHREYIIEVGAMDYFIPPQHCQAAAATA